MFLWQICFSFFPLSFNNSSDDFSTPSGGYINAFFATYVQVSRLLDFVSIASICASKELGKAFEASRRSCNSLCFSYSQLCFSLCFSLVATMIFSKEALSSDVFLARNLSKEIFLSRLVVSSVSSSWVSCCVGSGSQVSNNLGVSPKELYKYVNIYIIYIIIIYNRTNKYIV